MPTHAYRSSIFHCVANPQDVSVDASYAYYEDGVLVVDEGHVVRVGHASDVLPMLQGIAVTEYPDALIVPGFIDTHIHYPQVGIIGSYGAQLLDWLNTYTFPEESRFADSTHAATTAEFFLDELLRNGTTTALVFGTVHPQSVDAFFEAAYGRGLRMIAGKVLMDRNAPDALKDTPESGYVQSRALIERWHGKGRLAYAVTPRFAPTSSPEQLALAGKLFHEYPDLYMHTHLSENAREIEWVNSLFPERNGYLDVYDHHRLIGPRSVFAHGVHLCDAECARLGETGSAIAFCPTSNLFLGSGLFDLEQAQAHGVRVGLGTDVGGGTSFSQLRTLSEAYKVLQLRGQSLDPFQALYLATLGGAQALYLDDRIGNFEPGKEADFAVLDYRATPLLDYRLRQAETWTDRLFALITLGDDRVIKATYALGNQVHARDRTPEDGAAAQ
jgi:guanine deaminase